MKNTKLFCKKFFTWRLAFPTNKTLLTCVWKKHNILKTASEIHWQEISKQLKECVDGNAIKFKYFRQSIHTAWKLLKFSAGDCFNKMFLPQCEIISSLRAMKANRICQ